MAGPARWSVILKNGRSAVVCGNLAEDQRLEGCTTVAKSCSNHPEPTRCDVVLVKRAVQRQALSRLVRTCFVTRRSGVQIPLAPPSSTADCDLAAGCYRSSCSSN